LLDGQWRERRYGPAVNLAREWATLAEPWRQSLEQAYRTLTAGGLAVGAVIAADGVIIAEGRNRAYDPPGGDDPLQGNGLAHAEMNALARLPTGHHLGGSTLYSTHRPCRYGHDIPRCRHGRVPRHHRPTSPTGAGDPRRHRRVIVANVLFLYSVIVKTNADNRMPEPGGRAGADRTSP
jgi:hypothetical protein